MITYCYILFNINFIYQLLYLYIKFIIQLFILKKYLIIIV